MSVKNVANKKNIETITMRGGRSSVGRAQDCGS
jgi:hypothetical protein